MFLLFKNILWSGFTSSQKNIFFYCCIVFFSIYLCVRERFFFILQKYYIYVIDWIATSG